MRCLVLWGVMGIWAIAGCQHTPTVVVEQAARTMYNDVGTNGQVVVAKRDMVIRRAEILAVAQSWPAEKAKAKGSDVLLMLLDETFATLAIGRLPRDEVPTTKHVWAGADFDRPVRMEAGRSYVLRVVEVSRGGAYGWNNYGFAEGNPYPGGGLTNRFSTKDDLDYAFRLLE
ncbi:MAG: hypothetical protein AAF911_12235 [Planctomycetota bacterium]